MNELVATRQTTAAIESQNSASHFWSRQSGINDLLSKILIVFVAIVPIPFGSNRPFFWAINAAVIGLIATIYVWQLARLGERFHVGFGRIWPSVTLYVLLCLYLALQALPLGTFAPLASIIQPYLTVVTAQGEAIAMTSISITPSATLLMLLRWATFGAFYFLVLQIAGNQQRRDLILHAVLAIVVFYAIFGLASLLQLGDTILGLKKWAYEGSATATFVNRNSFATFLAFGAVVAVSLIAGTFVTQWAETGRGVKRRIDPMILVYLVGLAIIVAALLATQSRMGTFSALAGSVVVLLFCINRVPGLWVRALILTPLIVITLVGAVYLFGQNLFERLGSVSSAADVRLDLYRQIVDMIAARPWLGYGGGSFELAYQLFHRLPVSPDLVWDRAHNSYLGLVAELGLVGGAIPILLALFSLFRIVSRLSSSRFEWSAKATALGVLIVGAVHSLTDFSLEIEANTIMFLLLVGLGSVAAKRPRPAK